MVATKEGTQVDVGTVLTTIHGVPMEIKDPENPDAPAEPLTLGIVCVNALLGQYADEQRLSGMQKTQRFELARRINNALKRNGMVKFAAKEIVTLQSVIPKMYNTNVTGQAFVLLDPNVLGSREDVDEAEA